MSADDQEALNEQKPLVTRLREESRGREVVRVADPADGSYCIDFDRDNSVFPEYEATQWLMDFRKRHPQHKFATYEVRKVRVYSLQEELMQEAANEIERLQKELNLDSKRGV